MIFFRPPFLATASIPLFFLGTVTLGSISSASAEERDPQVRILQPGVELTLVAEHPDLVTPTGVDVDGEGRIWLIASHTHQPPEDYAGPDFDEILVFDPDGTRSVFHQGSTFHGMDLELGADGWVYVAERARVLRLRDSTGDGRADEMEVLADLVTESDYPHNGLAGLAWHPDGDLFFGLGENFAKPWTLTGTDGEQVSGAGEGGVFRCRPDGTELQRIAMGMWNPFAVCVREDGEIFVADNDPGERPPCRLLHIMEGGDYGYQRKYGGESHHPFVTWNGGLRGTLPMVRPTGEAPCGILPLGNGLLIPSWSDHLIDFFPLRREGATFAAERISLVSGSRYFRPVCIAEDLSRPGENSIRTWYLTDWVDGRYPVHGYGRLWRLEIDLEKADWVGTLELEPENEEAKFASDFLTDPGGLSRSELLKRSQEEDSILARIALLHLADSASTWKPDDLDGMNEAERISTVLALRIAGADPSPWIPRFLRDESSGVVFESLRWIAEAELAEFLSQVDELLGRSDLTFEVFEGGMAAWNTLNGVPEQGVRDTEKLLSRVLDEESSPRLRSYALRLLPVPVRAEVSGDPAARHRLPKELTRDVFRDLLATEDAGLSREAVRVLSGVPVFGGPLLATVAEDESRPPELRAEAIVGLAGAAESHMDLLVALAGSDERSVREEALRALRNRPLEATSQARIRDRAKQFPESAAAVAALLEPAGMVAGRPAIDDVEGWIARLEGLGQTGDPRAGERIFHHPSIALCAECHRHDGRGKVVGPDLTTVGEQGDRHWLVESIVQPDREVAPEYQARAVTLNDGSVHVGIRLRSSVREQVRDSRGFTLTFDRDDIASMEELDNSLMPPGLVFTMTDQELLDLLAFLETNSMARE